MGKVNFIGRMARIMRVNILRERNMGSVSSFTRLGIIMRVIGKMASKKVTAFFTIPTKTN